MREVTYLIRKPKTRQFFRTTSFCEATAKAKEWKATLNTFVKEVADAPLTEAEKLLREKREEKFRERRLAVSES